MTARGRRWERRATSCSLADRPAAHRRRRSRRRSHFPPPDGPRPQAGAALTISRSAWRFALQAGNLDGGPTVRSAAPLSPGACRHPGRLRREAHSAWQAELLCGGGSDIRMSSGNTAGSRRSTGRSSWPWASCWCSRSSCSPVLAYGSPRLGARSVLSPLWSTRLRYGSVRANGTSRDGAGESARLHLDPPALDAANVPLGVPAAVPRRWPTTTSRLVATS